MPPELSITLLKKIFLLNLNKKTAVFQTRPLREKMTKHMEYNAALLYGALMQLRIKMDNVYTTMKKFKPQQTKFMWYAL